MTCWQMASSGQAAGVVLLLVPTIFHPNLYCIPIEEGKGGERERSRGWQGEGEVGGERAHFLSLPMLTAN
jgi:hypothetical protein